MGKQIWAHSFLACWNFSLVLACICNNLAYVFLFFPFFTMQVETYLTSYIYVLKTNYLVVELNQNQYLNTYLASA